MLSVLVAATLVQVLGWAWVAAGVRRVRESAPAPLAEVAPPLEIPDASPAGTGPTSVADERQRDGIPSEGLPISVVIAARNEAERLPALLDALAAQTHRPFDVVVVDDRSTDRTAQIARWRAQDAPVPLRLVQVTEDDLAQSGLPPKKHALERGVEAASHDRLAFTDADGRPGPGWLATLAHHATAGDPDRQQDDGAVLVGYGPYQTAAGGLNRFIRYETVTTAALAAAGVGHGRPWHAVGRNLSYPKVLLERLGGFAHSAGSLSGDDDLLVQEVARQDAAPVHYVWEADAAVPSPAASGWRSFWRQKRRHASAGTHYPAGVLIALGLFRVSNLVLWIGAPVLHLASGQPYGWGLLAAKLLLQRSVLGDTLDALGDEPDLRLWQPILDGLSAVYHGAFVLLGLLPTPRRW
ncbi:MAG: glycosyltransferase [Bacteroidota bacterium]